MLTQTIARNEKTAATTAPTATVARGDDRARQLDTTDKVVLSRHKSPAKPAAEPGLLAQGATAVKQGVKAVSDGIDGLAKEVKNFWSAQILSRFMQASKEEQAEAEKDELKKRNERMYWNAVESIGNAKRAEMESSYERRRNQPAS